MRRQHNSKLGRFWVIYNVISLIGILVINGYIVGLPFWPALSYAQDQKKPFDESTTAVTGEPDPVAPPVDEPQAAAPVGGSAYRGYPATVQRVVIPKLRVNHRIYEGPDARTLNRGIWRRPNGATPQVGGNTILAAHRITYDGFRAFYHLDKLTPGDQIVVHWNGQAYSYRVQSVYLTNPDDVSVENPSIDQVLTLYTCTPIPSFTQRIVVKAVAE